MSPLGPGKPASPCGPFSPLSPIIPGIPSLGGLKSKSGNDPLPGIPLKPLRPGWPRSPLKKEYFFVSASFTYQIGRRKKGDRCCSVKIQTHRSLYENDELRTITWASKIHCCRHFSACNQIERETLRWLSRKKLTDDSFHPRPAIPSINASFS